MAIFNSYCISNYKRVNVLCWRVRIQMDCKNLRFQVHLPFPLANIGEEGYVNSLALTFLFASFWFFLQLFGSARHSRFYEVQVQYCFDSEEGMRLHVCCLYSVNSFGSPKTIDLFGPVSCVAKHHLVSSRISIESNDLSNMGLSENLVPSGKLT